MSWKTEPGLRGLSCADFRAVELASEAERDTLLAELEAYFAGIRFSNNATAFETVKTYILEWAKKK